MFEFLQHSVFEAYLHIKILHINSFIAPQTIVSNLNPDNDLRKQPVFKVASVLILRLQKRTKNVFMNLVNGML